MRKTVSEPQNLKQQFEEQGGMILCRKATVTPIGAA